MSQSLPQNPQNPQTLADIVGLSVRMVRENALLMLRVLLLPSIASCACISISRLISAHWLKAPSADLAYTFQHIGALVLLLLIFSYAQWDLMIRGMALMRFCVGYANSYKEALAYTNRRLPALALIYSRAALLPVAVLIAGLGIGLYAFLFSQYAQILLTPCIVIGVLLSLSFIAAIVWSVLNGSLLLSVLACEDVSIRQIIQRSEYLSQTSFWRGGTFICFMGLVLVILSVALNVPLLVVIAFDQAFSTIAKTHNLVTLELPVYFEILTACWWGILNLILLAVALIADVLFYQDVRVRQEGIDISERLTRLI